MILQGFLYRKIMRLAHRFDWHYAPLIGPLEPVEKQGTTEYVRWCKWCGWRERVVVGERNEYILWTSGM